MIGDLVLILHLLLTLRTLLFFGVSDSCVYFIAGERPLYKAILLEFILVSSLTDVFVSSFAVLCLKIALLQFWFVFRYF